MKRAWTPWALLVLFIASTYAASKRPVTLERDSQLLSLLSTCSKEEQETLIERMEKETDTEIDVKSLRKMLTEYCEAKQYQSLLNLGEEADYTDSDYL